ncbi:MAG: 16S rRNA (cytosine(1402)-N(4))-methyltransferase RsmH [candidate division Zixibacteria bacterium]|nr:16S rRNA (cytosine(1402)-N(4))-methyltransferase RsmH [candidate division Zixibacteria bacterium]
MAELKNDGGYHEPVLVDRVVELLVTDRNGAYLDLTAGGGGHLQALAHSLSDRARLYGVDADPVAVERTTKALSQTVQFRNILQTPFAEIDRMAGQFAEDGFAGILIDLGLSSYQLDEPARGFSYRYDAPLDMRFDRHSGESAGELVNSLGEKQLERILREFGEERQAARIARAIVRERQTQMIATTAQLRDIVLAVVRPPHENKSLARVFQALRIAVNKELEQIDRVLPAALSLLTPGGRLAVIAYHSLEDRRIKRFFQQEAKGRCTCPPGMPVCACGSGPSMKLVTRKPVLPDENEISRNPRARSARLRVAERLT